MDVITLYDLWIGSTIVGKFFMIALFLVLLTNAVMWFFLPFQVRRIRIAVEETAGISYEQAKE